MSKVALIAQVIVAHGHVGAGPRPKHALAGDPLNRVTALARAVAAPMSTILPTQLA